MRADGLVGSGSENSPERERESGARAHDAAVYAHGPPVAPVVGSGVDDSDAWSVGILGFGSEHRCGAAGGVRRRRIRPQRKRSGQFGWAWAMLNPASVWTYPIWAVARPVTSILHVLYSPTEKRRMKLSKEIKKED